MARQDAGDPLATALLTRFDASIVDRTVERAAILEHDAGMPRDAAEALATDLYVATDLDAWLAPVIAELGRTGYARCVRSDGREYRRLDAEWFGYLAGLVARAEAVAARLPADDLATMRARWARITRYAALTGLLPVPAAATLSDKSRP